MTGQSPKIPHAVTPPKLCTNCSLWPGIALPPSLVLVTCSPSQSATTSPGGTILFQGAGSSCKSRLRHVSRCGWLHVFTLLIRCLATAEFSEKGGLISPGGWHSVPESQRLIIVPYSLRNRGTEGRSGKESKLQESRGSSNHLRCASKLSPRNFQLSYQMSQRDSTNIPEGGNWSLESLSGPKQKAMKATTVME